MIDDDIGESLVHHIWEGQHFSASNLRSTDGREIHILKPGFWNGDAGPDFVKAEIIIDGNLYEGDVEMHVKASEWRQHEHHLDPKYNQVILHTVLWDDQINLRTKKQNGEKIPTLALYEHLDESVGKLLGDFQDEQTGRDECRIKEVQLNPNRLVNVLERMGQERFIEKYEAIQQLLQHEDLEQILYEKIMEALGYAKNRKPFLELARKVPFVELAGKDALEIQAILFGVAGLLPSQNPVADIPDDDAAYEYVVEYLENIWQETGGHYQPVSMRPEQWRFFRLRPGNFPTRRIAGISHILAECTDKSLLLKFLPLIEEAIAQPEDVKKIFKKLRNATMPEASGFWEQHSTFYGRQHKKTTYLIGKDRAADILVNVVLPATFLWAKQSQSQQLEDAVQLLYDKHPKLQNNIITQKMMVRIFSDKQQAKMINSAKRQQGLIYLYKTFCLSKICDVCPILDGNTSS